jgi:2,4-dienoyl-CoA reductase-like NADH-dependent reductase (Old Yellow Enzyme family)
MEVYIKDKLFNHSIHRVLERKDKSMSLFSAFKIKEVEFKNRIGVSPMCQYSCEDGFATDWHLVHLGSRAIGGAGLVIAEATAIEPNGRISPADLGLWKDEQIEPLRRIAHFIESQGSVAGIQIGHAGRKASTAAPWEGDQALSPAQGGWLPIVSASNIPFDANDPVPEALTEAGILTIRRQFVDTARRALHAGFKLLEIHAAHGYLLHQFLSPLSNQRTDQYGGSFDNRIRVVKEVTRDIREVWPEKYPLLIRISATDWVESGGWDIEQSIQLARELKALGIDLVDVSSGGSVPHAKIPVGPGYQVSFAERIRKEADIMTAAVGMLTEATQVDHIVRSGQADLVLLARELLRDPYWPLHAAHQLGIDVQWPNQYQRAKPRLKQLQSH